MIVRREILDRDHTVLFILNKISQGQFRPSSFVLRVNSRTPDSFFEKTPFSFISILYTVITRSLNICQTLV